MGVLDKAAEKVWAQSPVLTRMGERWHMCVYTHAHTKADTAACTRRPRGTSGTAWVSWARGRHAGAQRRVLGFIATNAPTAPAHSLKNGFHERIWSSPPFNATSLYKTRFRLRPARGHRSGDGACSLGRGARVAAAPGPRRGPARGTATCWSPRARGNVGFSRRPGSLATGSRGRCGSGRVPVVDDHDLHKL